ncbi:MAG: flagellar basal body-associated FliL family protein [Candidatus Riflebacteria bacterium]
MTEISRRPFSFSRTLSTLGVPLVLIFSIKFFDNQHTNFGAFLNLPTLFLITGLSFFLLLGAHGKKFLYFIPESLKTLFFDPLEPSQEFSQIAMDGERFSLASGMIGVIVGLVILLGNLDDPSSIGPAMGMALLSVIYGLLISECFFSVIARAYQPALNDSTRETKQGMIMVFGGIFALLCCFFIMLFDFSPGLEAQAPAEKNEISFTEIPIETNLGLISEGHIIKLSACLKTTDVKSREILESMIPVFREKIIMLILKKEFQAMRTSSAYETLKSEVTSEINGLLRENGVQELSSIVFSEFLVK